MEELHKEVDGLKYSVHASSILDVDDMTDHVKTLSIKNKVFLGRVRRSQDGLTKWSHVRVAVVVMQDPPPPTG